MKKGFTLIELLAVIVILTLMAMIAIPIILGVVENVKKSAAKNSAIFYIEAVEKEAVIGQINDTNFIEPNQKYNVTSSNGENKSINEFVKVKGEIPVGTYDYISLDNKYKVANGELTFNDYLIVISGGEIVNIDKVENRVLPESLTLDPIAETINIYEKIIIRSTVLPENTTNKSVSYESSDESVVSIDKYGELIAKNSGTATVTVTANNNKALKQQFEITVINGNINISSSAQKLSDSTTITINYNDNVTKKYKIGTGSYQNYTEPFELTSYNVLNGNLQNEDGTITICAYGENVNGVTNEVCNNINILDLDMPTAPVITAPVNAPTLTSTGVIINNKVTIAYDNRSDIKNYYSIDNGQTWNEYTEPFVSPSTVLAKSVKNSGLTVSSSATPATGNYVGSEAFDSEGTNTCFQIWRNSGSKNGTMRYLLVDSSAWGKTVNINYRIINQAGNYNRTGYVYLYNSSGTVITNLSSSASNSTGTLTYNRSAVIEEGITSIGFNIWSVGSTSLGRAFAIYVCDVNISE